MEPQGIGVDGPAADPVDADAPGSELHGQVADGGLESRLGDPDGSVLRCVAATPDAGNGDDPTAPALHQRYGVLAAQHERPGVHVERHVPVEDLDVHDRLEGAEGRVVDQDVEAAEPVLDLLEHRLDRLGLAHVGQDDVRADAVLLGQGLDLLGGLDVAQGIDDHVGALLGELQHDRAPDAPASARDQRRSSGKDPFCHDDDGPAGAAPPLQVSGAAPVPGGDDRIGPPSRRRDRRSVAGAFASNSYVARYLPTPRTSQAIFS